MHKFMLKTPEFTTITTSTASECIACLRENTLDHSQTQKYGLCTILVSGIETWLHSKHAAKEMSLAEIGNIIRGPVKLAEVLGSNSEKHPWAPKHEYGKDFWNTITLLFKALESDSIGIEEKIVILEKLRLPNGLVFVRNLMNTNYLGGQ